MAKPLTQAELHQQLVPEIVQAIVCKPLMQGGDLTDCEVLMEAVLVGVVETIERIRASLAVPTDVLDRITENTSAALMRRRRIAIEAAQKTQRSPLKEVIS